MYNAHPYFSLKNLGKKVHILHGKIRSTFTPAFERIQSQRGWGLTPWSEWKFVSRMFCVFSV